MILIMLDKKLNICQQCVHAAKQANSLLDFVRQSTTSRLREVTLPLCSALLRCIWHARSISVFPSARETWMCWSSFSEKPEMMKGLEHLT